MKIAYVLNSTDPLGGASKSFMSLLKGVVQQGHHAVVVLPDDGKLKNNIESLGVETIVLSYRPNTYPYEDGLKDYCLWIPRLIARRYVNYRAYKQLAKMLADVDIVHTNVSVIDIGQRAAKRCGKPHVYHFREYGDLDFSFRYFPTKSLFMRTVDHSICITKDIQKHHGLSDSATSAVIYNGICHYSDVMPTPDNNHPDYLLFASRIEPAKGLEQLIDAYGRSGIDTPLWIAGATLKENYLVKIRNEISSRNLEDSIRFLGPREDMAQLMRNARCVIVPSEFEAFGRVMAEAMFQGCLVIGHDTGGTHEQFDNGLEYTGAEIGLRYKTTDELARLLTQIITTDNEEMRRRGFQSVNHFYSIESNVQSIINLYKKILS